MKKYLSNTCNTLVSTMMLMYLFRHSLRLTLMVLLPFAPLQLIPMALLRLFPI